MRRILLPNEEILRAYEAGSTIAEIAAEFSTTRSTIQRRLTAAGTPLRRAGPRALRQSISMPGGPAVLGYIAGLFDGEGHLGVRRRTGRVVAGRVAIYSTTPEVIAWLQAQMGGYVRWDHARTRRRGWKAMGTWTIWRANDIRSFLGAVLPYLIIKRELALLILSGAIAKPST